MSAPSGSPSTRDDWGIPHVSGKTDADAVFGVMCAQAEDDFNQVETNLINAMGRLAETEGDAEIFRDLRMKLFVDPADLTSHYAASPDSLKVLMDGWADGLNYFLRTHPKVAPRLITHFEPWMALGVYPPEPTGSNGFAIAPSNSASHHALLWINPHTSFFFRAEAQVTSDEGLNAYGALT